MPGLRSLLLTLIFGLALGVAWLISTTDGARWLAARVAFGFGPTPTPLGRVSVRAEPLETGGHRLDWRIDGATPAWIRIAIPGRAAVTLPGEAREVHLPEARP